MNLPREKPWKKFCGLRQMTEIVLIAMLAVLVIFQIALALGAPLGEAAWGGRYKNALPAKLRIASAFSAVLLLFMITVVASKADRIVMYPDNFTSTTLWVMAIYFGIGIVMNVVSRSKIERIWSPYSAVLCLLCVLILV